MTTPKEIEAIDVHGHYGAFLNSPQPLQRRFRSGDMEVVAARARLARTAITVVSPLQALMPRFDNDAVGGNEHAAAHIPSHPTLRAWAVIDPRKEETFAQASRLLELPHFVGVKIHPEEHDYRICDQGRRLYEFARRHDAVLLTHSGERNSLPVDFVPFANDFPEVRLILAHLGCGFDSDPSHQVRAIQQSKHGNLYVDTSSVQSITPGLIEWAVAEIGADHILYGTDTPLYSAGMQRVRIDEADISGEDKTAILRDNALRLLNLGI